MGSWPGLPDGSLEGDEVGSPVGHTEGVPVGHVVGAVGIDDETSEGIFEGSPLG